MDYFMQDTSFNPLWRKRCVLGCDSETPLCPECPDGQECSLIPPSCEACQQTICVDSNRKSDEAKSSDGGGGGGGSNTAAIAGGVVGGVVVVAIITYCVWRFCIKPRRAEEQQSMHWPDGQSVMEKDGASRRDVRNSTHTVGSIASTVLTRASNVIQIAYIPGVTNRGSAPSPSVLVPPVPPIPMALTSSASNASTPAYDQEHFFVPGDLRDTVYADRQSYARNSVASTIYGKNAIVSPVPAQTALRGKAAMVSVTKNAGGDLTPPMPSVDFEKYGATAGPPSPAFSVGSTFLNHANAATIGKPNVVKVASGSGLATAYEADSKSIDSITDASGKPATGTNSPMPTRPSPFRDSTATTVIASPTPDQGPFRDPSPQSPHPSTRSLGALASGSGVVTPPDGVVELDGQSRGVGTGTPFGDEHEIKK